MPELPDVETFRRRLKGRRVRSSDRRGKVLFVNIDPAGALAMHFGTNGSLDFLAEGEAQPAYVRVQFAFEDGSELSYVNPRRLGRVSLVESAAEYIAAAGLGPDALDPEFNLDRQYLCRRDSVPSRHLSGVGREWSGQKHHRNPVRDAQACASHCGGGRRRRWRRDRAPAAGLSLAPAPSWRPMPTVPHPSRRG
jgi:Formamidopyrimidine-DNA glycosylase N-terminal domain